MFLLPEYLRQSLFIYSMGLAGVRTTDNEKYFDERPLTVVYYDVDYARNPKGSNYWRNRYYLLTACD